MYVHIVLTGIMRVVTMCDLDIILAFAMAGIFGVSGFLGMRMYEDHKKTKEQKPKTTSI